MRGAEARPVHDDLMGPVGEAIERAVSQDGVIEEGHPLVHRPIARGHGRGALIPLDQDVVEVARLLDGELPEPELNSWAIGLTPDWILKRL